MALLLLLSSLSFSACYDPRKGALSPDARTELDTYADRFIDVEIKYLKASELLAQLLDEAAAIPNDAAAMEHIRKFADDNELALEKIGAAFDGWQRHVNDEDLVTFLQLLHEQPSSRKLRVLVPRFRARIAYNAAWRQEFDTLISTFMIRR
ncbi:MAG: hypothetical protein D6722_21255 [Bacteroidetes bacterium]|nr:MAG: hypothetical protein D6722_21255 [Bacteroidota bacterium]